ncbi:MAG: SIS domain-containing protein [Candidatus Staskawiczbacteria bacterium]|nr:SIS domain-containing protein [Candidatus Staskawiczbacteria bacterium]
MKEEIKNLVQESASVKQALHDSPALIDVIEHATKTIIEALKNGKKMLIFGNGGSAADAQHFAGELVNRFKIDRAPLPAISLVTDTSVLTSIANDFGYDYVFSKQIEALGESGDVAIAITTSDVELKQGGHSVNIANGLVSAKNKGLITIGLVSDKSDKILGLLDIAIRIPSKNTPRIQESHILVIHIISEIAEKALYEKNKST